MESLCFSPAVMLLTLNQNGNKSLDNVAQDRIQVKESDDSGMSRIIGVGHEDLHHQTKTARGVTPGRFPL